MKTYPQHLGQISLPADLLNELLPLVAEDGRIVDCVGQVAIVVAVQADVSDEHFHWNITR